MVRVDVSKQLHIHLGPPNAEELFPQKAKALRVAQGKYCKNAAQRRTIDQIAGTIALKSRKEAEETP